MSKFYQEDRVLFLGILCVFFLDGYIIIVIAESFRLKPFCGFNPDSIAKRAVVCSTGNVGGCIYCTQAVRLSCAIEIAQMDACVVCNFGVCGKCACYEYDSAT